MNPTAGSAQVKSPSQARVEGLQADGRRNWLTAPSGEYIQVQAIAAAAPGMICGRNIKVRAVAPTDLRLDLPHDRGHDQGDERPGGT